MYGEHGETGHPRPQANNTSPKGGPDAMAIIMCRYYSVGDYWTHSIHKTAGLWYFYFTEPWKWRAHTPPPTSPRAHCFNRLNRSSVCRVRADIRPSGTTRGWGPIGGEPPNPNRWFRSRVLQLVRTHAAPPHSSLRHSSSYVLYWYCKTMSCTKLCIFSLEQMEAQYLNMAVVTH